MDEIYSGIFSTLYQTQTRLFWQAAPGLRGVNGWAGQIKQAIDATSAKTQAETNVVVRSDAKYFLWVNVLHMIAEPIAISEKESPDRVLEAVKHDIELVLTSAAEQFANEPAVRREVSAHRVVDMLSRNWQRLKLSNVRLWDGHEFS